LPDRVSNPNGVNLHGIRLLANVFK